MTSAVCDAMGSSCCSVLDVRLVCCAEGGRAGLGFFLAADSTSSVATLSGDVGRGSVGTSHGSVLEARLECCIGGGGRAGLGFFLATHSASSVATLSGDVGRGFFGASHGSVLEADVSIEGGRAGLGFFCIIAGGTTSSGAVSNRFKESLRRDFCHRGCGGGFINIIVISLA